MIGNFLLIFFKNLISLKYAFIIMYIICVLIFFVLLYRYYKHDDDELTKQLEELNSNFNSIKEELNDLITAASERREILNSGNEDFDSQYDLNTLVFLQSEVERNFNEMSTLKQKLNSPENDLSFLINKETAGTVLEHSESLSKKLVDVYSKYLEEAYPENWVEDMNFFTQEFIKILFNFEQNLTYISSSNILALMQLYDMVHVSNFLEQDKSSLINKNPLFEGLCSFDKKSFLEVCEPENFHKSNLLNNFFSISTDLLVADSIEFSKNLTTESWIESNRTILNENQAFKGFRELAHVNTMGRNPLIGYILKSTP